MMQRTENVCICQGCGHPIELHQVGDPSEAAGVLQLHLRCSARGCDCACYSGEVWRRPTAVSDVPYRG